MAPPSRGLERWYTLYYITHPSSPGPHGDLIDAGGGIPGGEHPPVPAPAIACGCVGGGPGVRGWVDVGAGHVPRARATTAYSAAERIAARERASSFNEARSENTTSAGPTNLTTAFAREF